MQHKEGTEKGASGYKMAIHMDEGKMRIAQFSHLLQYAPAFRREMFISCMYITQDIPGRSCRYIYVCHFRLSDHIHFILLLLCTAI